MEAQFLWQFYRLFERGGNILLGNSESMLVLFSFILDRNRAGSWLVFLFMVRSLHGGLVAWIKLFLLVWPYNKHLSRNMLL